VSYLKQAEEIFANGSAGTEEVSHPEAFIRARALTLWRDHAEGSAAAIADMIEGAAALEELDIIGQRRLAGATRKLIENLLRPKWFQTPATLGHAKMFFSNFKPATGVEAMVSSGEGFNLKDAKTRDYLCYVLLDFAKADPDLEEIPLAAAVTMSRQLDMEEHFEKLAVKELKMKARDMRRIKEQAAEMLAKAEANGG
jgi:hypothetical protein